MNRALNRLWRPVSSTGFPPFRVNGRPIRVKKFCGLKNIGIRVCGRILRALHRGGEPQVGEVTPGGTSWEPIYLFSFALLEYNLYTVSVGVCLLVLKILTEFQTKKCKFSLPFSD